MKKYLILTIALVLNFNLSGQGLNETRIGLALSGGGAKGLAHIGILAAIDSAGLEIDAITGTSMGAIVGSLYAIGYSGKEIEQLARDMNWNNLFLTTLSLNQVDYFQKEDYGRFPLQLPVEKWKVKPYTGILEAQGIWNELGKLYMPAYRESDFSKYNIPFLCIATDLETGEPVIMRDGDIATAVRASMAIPSIFTVVDYKDTKLVDGGVVLNFPVKNLKEFGVDYFIGVNVSMGLLESEKLITPIDILLQIAFFTGVSGSQDHKDLCNLLIQPDLDGFSAASFNSADSIIDIGIAAGKEYYPYFRKLADSLQSVNGSPKPIGSRLPAVEQVMIDAIEVSGLTGNDKLNFIGQLGIFEGQGYSAVDLSEAIEKAYGTLAYRRISYTLDPTDPDHAVIKFQVEKHPRAALSFGISYNSYSSSALIVGINSQNDLLNNSRSSLKLNIGENFRGRIKHQLFFTQKRRWGLEISGYYEHFKFPIYHNFEQQYLYKSNYGRLDMNMFQRLGRSSAFGFGIKREMLGLIPDISSDSFTATNKFWKSYLFFKRNTLDEPIFSHKGVFFELQAGWIFNQNPDASFIELSELIQLGDSIRASIGNHFQLNIKQLVHVPIRNKTTLFYKFNSGINFTPQRAFLNHYSVGGLHDFLRNQIPFAGFKENKINTNSIISFQLGLQIEPLKNFYTTLRANMALYDFIGLDPAEWGDSNFLSGYSLSAGLRSIIGPIELSLLYNDQKRSLAGHLMVGFAF